MRILFVTRKYPPSIGGMQLLSYYVTTTVAARVPAQLIKWKGEPLWLLPLFYPYAFFRALIVILFQPVDLIHIGDPVLAPLGVLLRLIGRVPVAINAHGLDVVYPNRIYQKIIPACLRELDLVICISQYTRQQCLVRGVPADRLCLIPVGVDPQSFVVTLPQDEAATWAQRWSLDLSSGHVLLSVGRLVPRKGVYFFVSQVLPDLIKQRTDWLYLIVGDGPDSARIAAAIEDYNLADHVRMLGKVTDEERLAAYAMADVFVMPNIPVKGDVEGFGIVTLEARAAGLAMIAASIEGVGGDSLVQEENILLVPPADVEAFLKAVDGVLKMDLSHEARLRRRQYVVARYAWTHIAEEYLVAFQDLCAKSGKKPRTV
jgi:glycosyltransferase involved in cell wall biosynthesis